MADDRSSSGPSEPRKKKALPKVDRRQQTAGKRHTGDAGTSGRDGTMKSPERQRYHASFKPCVPGGNEASRLLSGTQFLAASPRADIFRALMIARYTLPEMAAIWTDQRKYEIWLEIETLACEAQAELGHIPKEDAQEIRAQAKFELNEIEEIERRTNHDVI